MITRPLDLASRLSPPSRNLDALFYVNVALVAFFFTLFFSRYVLSPAFVVGLPLMPNATSEEVTSTHVIKVLASGQIYSERGPLTLNQLRDWLQIEGRTREQPSLLVEAPADITLAKLDEIINTARLAGFKVLMAYEPVAK